MVSKIITLITYYEEGLSTRSVTSPNVHGDYGYSVWFIIHALPAP